MAFVPTLRQALLGVADVVRGIAGIGVLDQRPTSVTIVQQQWIDGVRGGPNGATIVSKLVLPNFTTVRHVSQREIASSGGRYEQGDVMVRNITPQYPDLLTGKPAGGFTLAQLDPPVGNDNGLENLYLLAKQSGATGITGTYQLKDVQRDRDYHFHLVLGRTSAGLGTTI